MCPIHLRMEPASAAFQQGPVREGAVHDQKKRWQSEKNEVRLLLPHSGKRSSVLSDSSSRKAGLFANLKLQIQKKLLASFRNKAISAPISLGLLRALLILYSALVIEVRRMG